MIYFIQNTTTRSIKIGWTNRGVAKRLSSLQTATEHELVLLCSMSGSREVEKSLHQQLAAHRIRGEWFRNHPDVIGVVSRLVLDAIGAAGEQAGEARHHSPRRIVATRWLIERFRESSEWLSDELFALARKQGVSRNSIFEAKDSLGMPKLKRTVNNDGDVEWAWWVPSDWPHLQNESAQEG